MHKTVSIVKQDKELIPIVDRMFDITKRAEERFEFLKKQMDDLKARCKAEAKPCWDEIEEFLKKNDRLPKDYSKEKYSIHLDDEDGTICVHDKTAPKNNPIFDLLIGK